MIDARFFKNPPPLSLTDIVSLVNIHVKYEDMFIKFSGVASLEDANTSEISCLHNAKYLDALKHTQAGACVVSEEYAAYVPVKTIAFISSAPYRDFAKIASLFFPSISTISEGVSPFAKIHPSVRLGDNVEIGAFSVIDECVEIGNDTRIGNFVSIKRGVKIGDRCKIEDHVSITHTLMGKEVFIKPGARIGQPGFGFHMDEKGHFDVPQLGRVIIGDDVQIGANTTIDRGSQKDTIIGKGVRIDNLVQIAHNVQIGDNSVLVAQVGVAGSTTLGKYVIAAGQVGIAGHLKIGNGVKIAAQSGLMRDVDDGQTVGGSPAVPIRDWHRQTLMLQKLLKKEKGA